MIKLHKKYINWWKKKLNLSDYSILWLTFIKGLIIGFFNLSFLIYIMKKIIAGVDEVGRGSLIGPVYAAAVILNKSINKKLLKDSKSLSKNKREEVFSYIKKNSIWAIGQASVKEIEKMNILHASLLAMKRAIKKLKKKPNLVLIDGNKLPDLKNYNLKYVIKGDQKIP